MYTIANGSPEKNFEIADCKKLHRINIKSTAQIGIIYKILLAMTFSYRKMKGRDALNFTLDLIKKQPTVKNN
jgi:hypothetical protein